MKTKKEILAGEIGCAVWQVDEKLFEGVHPIKIRVAMQKYAEQAIDEASQKVEAGVKFGERFQAEFDNWKRNGEDPPKEGEDYEVAVSRQSILQIKDELK